MILKHLYGKSRIIILFSIELTLVILFVQAQLLAGNQTKLVWTAPGDSFYKGKATLYDIRYSSRSVASDTIKWWKRASKVLDIPIPSYPGHRDSCLIPDLSLEKPYYFALKTSDEVFNWSEISNITNIPIIACADINWDGSITILDVIIMIRHIYKDEPFPTPYANGDVDNSGKLDILDAVYLLNYLYKSGPPPYCRN